MSWALQGVMLRVVAGTCVAAAGAGVLASDLWLSTVHMGLALALKVRLTVRQRPLLAVQPHRLLPSNRRPDGTLELSTQ